MCVCVCSGCTLCYISVYQCGLWSNVQVCLCGDWMFVFTWLWEGCVCVAGVCGGGLRCWGLCVFVIKFLRRLWVFSVVISLDSGSGCVVHQAGFSHYFMRKMHGQTTLKDIFSCLCS